MVKTKTVLAKTTTIKNGLRTGLKTFITGAKHLTGGKRGEAKFKIKHKNRCLQKSKLVDWGAKRRLGGRPPCLILSPAVEGRQRKSNALACEDHFFEVLGLL